MGGGWIKCPVTVMSSPCIVNCVTSTCIQLGNGHVKQHFWLSSPVSWVCSLWVASANHRPRMNGTPAAAQTNCPCDSLKRFCFHLCQTEFWEGCSTKWHVTLASLAFSDMNAWIVGANSRTCSPAVPLLPRHQSGRPTCGSCYFTEGSQTLGGRVGGGRHNGDIMPNLWHSSSLYIS